MAEPRLGDDRRGARQVHRHGNLLQALRRNPTALSEAPEHSRTREPWRRHALCLRRAGGACGRRRHYWPEFAQNGKARITVRQLLAHQAGLYALDERPDRDVVGDADRLAALLARQKPAWEPGTRQAYHAVTIGYYEGELLRRIDPRHRTIGQFFQDEIATPLGLDLYIRLPGDIPNSRFARPAPVRRSELLRGFPLRVAIDTMNPRSKIVRA
ncbi:MAG: beta-lactamase family protein, partial [Acidimicrobiia bacterium]|nr:beta-lactamase family protein [Acidimicrobiia bacterium]